jgi:hypothetical protein
MYSLLYAGWGACGMGAAAQRCRERDRLHHLGDAVIGSATGLIALASAAALIVHHHRR